MIVVLSLPSYKELKALVLPIFSLIYYHSSKIKEAWVDGVAIKAGTSLVSGEHIRNRQHMECLVEM